MQKCPRVKIEKKKKKGRKENSFRITKQNLINTGPRDNILEEVMATMSNAEWAGCNQTKEERESLNHPQLVPNKDLCNLLLERWCNSFSGTFLFETSKNKTEKKKNNQHVKTYFQVNGLQAVKDKDPGNKWSEPNDWPSSPPWENFQATTQGEGAAVAHQSPWVRWWSGGSGKTKPCRDHRSEHWRGRCVTEKELCRSADGTQLSNKQ